MDGSDEFFAGKLFKSTCISVSVIDSDSYETEIIPVSVFNFPYILKLGKLSEDHPVTDHRMLFLYTTPSFVQLCLMNMDDVTKLDSNFCKADRTA